MSTTLTSLPAIGAELEGGIFAGVITQPDGMHVAVVLLPDRAQDIKWKAAVAWAEKLGAQLPTRPIAALLFANVKKHLVERWHWTSEEYDASSAWGCSFYDGYQYDCHKSSEGCAVAARLIPLTA